MEENSDKLKGASIYSTSAIGKDIAFANLQQKAFENLRNGIKFVQCSIRDIGGEWFDVQYFFTKDHVEDFALDVLRPSIRVGGKITWSRFEITGLSVPNGTGFDVWMDTDYDRV